MKPENYFPRKPGEEPFLSPFTNASKPKDPEQMAKRICAWCKKELGEKEVVGSAQTNGICEECLAKESAGPEKNK